jgi:CTP:molybdopterin cytidylyltransferase MocA
VSERLLAIILAAGAGARMGGAKATLVVEGEPLARRHARRMREAGCEDVVLVTRAELALRFAADAAVVVSAAPDPAGSLALGLRALAPAPGDLVVVTPVDAWPARPETIAALIAAVRGGALAATPSHGGRGGHPVVARGAVLAPLAEAPRPLRGALAALGSARVRIDVDDASVTRDLDTPADVLEATGRPPHFEPLLAPVDRKTPALR